MSEFQWENIDVANAGNIKRGTISNIDISNLTATVKGIGETIPIHYHCEEERIKTSKSFDHIYPDEQDKEGAYAFTPGDEVLVMFRKSNNKSPIIVGFADGIRDCGLRFKLFDWDNNVLSDDPTKKVQFWCYDSTKTEVNITYTYDSKSQKWSLEFEEGYTILPEGYWFFYQCVDGFKTQYQSINNDLDWYKPENLTEGRGYYEDTIEKVVKFYLKVQIDGNDLYWGGQQLEVYYTDIFGQFKNAAMSPGSFTAPTDKYRDLYGYTMGLVGPFDFEQRDFTKPVYVRLDDYRDISPTKSNLFDDTFYHYTQDQSWGLHWQGWGNTSQGKYWATPCHMLGMLIEDAEGDLYYKAEENIYYSEEGGLDCQAESIIVTETNNALKYGLYKDDPGGAIRCSRVNEIFVEINIDSLIFKEETHVTPFSGSTEITVADIDIPFNLQIAESGRYDDVNIDPCGNDSSGDWSRFTSFCPPIPFPIINFVQQTYWEIDDENHRYYTDYAVRGGDTACFYSGSYYYYDGTGPGEFVKSGNAPVPAIVSKKTGVAGMEDLGMTINVDTTLSYLGLHCEDDGCVPGDCLYGTRNYTFKCKSVAPLSIWF